MIYNGALCLVLLGQWQESIGAELSRHRTYSQKEVEQRFQRLYSIIDSFGKYLQLLKMRFNHDGK